MSNDTNEPAAIIGESGASGKGWSELKDIECEKRYMFIKQAEAANAGKPRQPTPHDDAYRNGIFMHAARAHWLVNGQTDKKELVLECCEIARKDCIKQDMPCTELTYLEYSLMFTNYVNYWAIRPKVKTYACELYLEHNFKPVVLDNAFPDYTRSTRYDDISEYADVGAYCIGEFKTTSDLSGALKYYTEWNPQILLQQLIYDRANHNHVPIVGTMVDIWDKYRNKGTRHFVPINHVRLNKFEVWLKSTLYKRSMLLNKHFNPQTNFLVCNTFNDAYKSQCQWKERCMNEPGDVAE